jgi:hypothetical protein
MIQKNAGGKNCFKNGKLDNLNRSVTVRRLTAARATQNNSRASPFMLFCSATFFCARKNASHFSLSGAKKRQLPPER